MMSPRSLQIFIAVAKCGSISLAAEQQHLTQSAVSKRIALLEQNLDSQLFERHNRRVSLTQAGEVLLKRAQNILNLLQDTKQEIQGLKQEMSGKLAIAASHHIGLHRLPPALSLMQATYPKVEIDLQFMASEQAQAALENRQVELALITLKNQYDNGFTYQTLWQDELLPVCALQHQLAQFKRLSLTDLCQYPVILPAKNTITFNLVEPLFTTQGLNLKLAMATNYLETIKMMVSVGLGWSFLPKGMLNQQLHVLHWQDKVQLPCRHLGILKLKNRALSRSAQAFMQLLQQS